MMVASINGGVLAVETDIIHLKLKTAITCVLAKKIS